MHDDNEWIALLENEYDEYIINKKRKKEKKEKKKFDWEFEEYLKKKGWMTTVEWTEKCMKEIVNKKKQKLEIVSNSSSILEIPPDYYIRESSQNMVPDKIE